MRAAAAALVAAVLIAGCGADEETRPDPFTAVEQAFEKPDPSRRAAPRWSRLAVLRGSGSDTATVRVDPRAIQWRVRWRCSGGRFSVAVAPPPSGPDRASGRCAGARAVTFIGAGSRRLAITASGDWRLVVDQQLDTPVDEPPLAGMRPSRLVAQGRFRGVERTGRGTAALYRLPSGRLALRFEDFVTDANSDLFVWLSRAAAPRTTRRVVAAPHRTLDTLTSTVGDQNYVLPRGVGLRDVRSVVIWCRPVRIAYAAAVLSR